MKFKNIYTLCRDNFDIISNINHQETTSSGRACSKITGWIAARDALVVLKKIGSLEEESNNLLKSIYPIAKDEIYNFIV